MRPDSAARGEQLGGRGEYGLRVLHVSEVTAGGVLSLVRTYAREQEGRGHQVYVLAAEPMGFETAKFRHWSAARRRPYSFPVAVRQLAAAAHELRPDVIHLHSFFAGLLGRTRVREIPPSTAVVYQPHSWSFGAFDSAILRRAVIRLERSRATRTDRVVGNCREEIEEGVANGVHAPCTVLGLPLDTDFFTPVDLDERAQIRHRLGLDDRVVATCVGRLSRQKAQDRLVAAWEAAPVPDTLLLLVGSGDDTALRRLAPREWGQSIVAVGHQDDIRSWLRASDLLVQASRYEGQSVAVAEALACGLPAVVLDVNGSRETIDSGKLDPAGAVVPQTDMAALLSACGVRAADPGLRAKESQAARERAVALFSVQAVMDRLDGAYAQAIATATT
jgi:glycosyltransferase involved in cell wall biosynthesis